MRTPVRHPRVACRLLAPVLLLGLLVGCSSQEEKYCAAVKDNQTRLTEIASQETAAALFDAAEIYRDLAGHAPDDIRVEWRVVIDAIERLEKTVDDLGIDPADYDPAHPPEGLTQDQLDRLRAAAVALVDPETTEAMQSVEQQARDVCGTPLTL